MLKIHIDKYNNHKYIVYRRLKCGWEWIKEGTCGGTTNTKDFLKSHVETHSCSILFKYVHVKKEFRWITIEQGTHHPN